MADLCVDVRVAWRRRWLLPLVLLVGRLKWRRAVNALLWAMPLEFHTGRQVQRRRVRLDGDGSIGWACG